MPQETPGGESSKQLKILISSAAAYCIANIGWWIQPALIHEVILRYHVGAAGAGFVASVEMISIAFCSFLFAKVITKISLRQLAWVGAAVALFGSVLSYLATDYNVLLLARSITGIGEGAMLAVASAALAGFNDPVRAYAKINVISILFGSATVFILPTTAQYFGGENAVFPTIIGGVFILSIFLLLMPRNTRQRGADNSTAPPSYGIFSWKLLRLVSAVFILSVTAGAMWSFYFILGAKAGLNEIQINTAVGIAAVISVCGSLIATVIGEKFGHISPITLGIFVLTAAIAVTACWHEPLAFRTGASLIVIGMYFLVPYFYGLAAAQDPTGRDSAIIAGTFLFTGAVGPYLGGFIIEFSGVGSIAILAFFGNVVAWLLFFIVNRSRKPGQLAIETP